jgi:hypothetical protein
MMMDLLALLQHMSDDKHFVRVQYEFEIHSVLVQILKLAVTYNFVPNSIQGFFKLSMTSVAKNTTVIDLLAHPQLMNDDKHLMCELYMRETFHSGLEPSAFSMVSFGAQQQQCSRTPAIF